MKLPYPPLSLLILALCGNPVGAQVVWTNAASDIWNTAANWSPNQVPGPADSVIITNAGVTVSLAGSAAAGSIFLDSGSALDLAGQTLELSGPLTLGPDGFFTVDSGTLDGVTNAVLNGTFGWTGGFLSGTLVLATNSTLVILAEDANLPGCSLTNFGTVEWISGNLHGGDGALVSNYGLWDVLNDQALDNAWGGAVGTEFDNYGQLLKSGDVASSSFQDVSFYQVSGLIDVMDGLELDFQGGGGFYGGSVATNYSGLTVLSGGYFSFSGTVTTTNTWEDGADLLGQNVIFGSLTWISGTWAGAQSVTIATNATLIVAGGDGTNDLSDCNVTNYGTVEWTGGTLQGGYGAYIINNGLWDTSSDQAINSADGEPAEVFENYGTFRKSGGQGGASSFKDVVFNQLAGKIDVQPGLEVDFQGGGSFSGGYINTNASGRAVLSAGLFNLNGTVTGTNTWENSGGLLGDNVLHGGLTWVAGTWAGASSVTVAPGSKLVVAGGAASNNFSGCLLTNNGTVDWTGGSLQADGALVVNNGLWEMRADGSLTGAGTVFNNAGIVRKIGGTNATAFGILLQYLGGFVEIDRGTLLLQSGSFDQGSGTLTVALGGTNAGQWGQLSAGAISLGGPLNLQLVNGFVPPAGSQFRILSCSTLSGAFTGTDLPAGLSIVYDNSGALVIATNAVTGAILTWPTPAPISYGTALGSGQLNARASVPGSFAYSPGPGTMLAAGLHEISVLFTPTNSAEFSPVACTVSLLVEPAPLTITARNLYMTLGSSIPPLTAAYSGFVNGDSPASLGGLPALFTPATGGSPPGSYPITVSLGSINDPNYVYSFLPGLLTIQQTDFYVAANGNDSNPGTLAQPFRSVGAAVLAEEAAGTNVHRNIYFRGGEYFNVCQSLQGPGDPGTDDSNLTIAGYSNETAVLYGGQPLTNWVATSNGWWHAALPPYPGPFNSSVNLLTNWEVRMLLVDGQMADRAQFPIDGSSLLYTNTGGTNYINYNEGDIPDSMVATNMEVMVDFSWDAQTLGVSAIDRNTQTIYFSGDGVRPDRGLDFTGVQTYRVYNTAEGMSRPGQFYFDRTNHIVNYWPLNGKDPNTSEIIVPTTQCMFYIFGYPGGSPWNITFSNLTLNVNAVDIENEGNFGFLWDYMSLIHAFYCTDLVMQDMTMGWCGGNALGMDYSFCTNAALLDSEIGFCGGYGVALRMAPCVISNNFIHDTGLISWQSPGVRVSQQGLVIQNSIFNSKEAAFADHDVDACTFTLNYVSNAMTVLRDLGAFYTYFGDATTLPHTNGNVVSSNVFQNVGLANDYDDSDPRDEYRPAVYFDEYTSNSVVQDNVFLDCKIPFFCNIATSNAVLGNIVFNTNAQYLRIYASPDSSPPNSIQANVFYSSTNILVDNPQIWDSWADNLFWSDCNPPLTNNVPQGAVIADPQFVAPPFAFGPNSPAPALGIAPLVWKPLARGVQFINPAPPMLLVMSESPGTGQFVLQVRSQPGFPVELQVSTDLRTWVSVTTFTPNTPLVNISNTISHDVPQEFWRAVQKP
jgi:hypothetical protein